MPSLSSGDEGFNPTLEDTSLKENPALAFNAFNSYISTESDYLPLVAAAGMLSLEAYYIAQLYLHNHYSPNYGINRGPIK